jgi:acyl carrier protein
MNSAWRDSLAPPHDGPARDTIRRLRGNGGQFLWDSLNHVRLIVTVEREFKVRFTAAEVSALKNNQLIGSRLQQV